MSDLPPTYEGYKRVKLPVYFVDNGQGAGYLRLMLEDGTYAKVWPDEALYSVMQEQLNRRPNDRDGATTLHQ